MTRDQARLKSFQTDVGSELQALKSQRDRPRTAGKLERRVRFQKGRRDLQGELATTSDSNCRVVIISYIRFQRYSGWLALSLREMNAHCTF